jgi:translation elongation factor EF-Tu-like GTPase
MWGCAKWLFMQVEYPFRNYNLFLYVYVLSFYNRAKEDKRFLEALEALTTKLVDGQVVVDRVERGRWASGKGNEMRGLHPLSCKTCWMENRARSCDT